MIYIEHSQFFRACLMVGKFNYYLYLMSHQEDSQEDIKKRRARNDPNNRDYICPCGKSYLSYPALFTHVKQKHNGKAPGQLIKPKNENVKRGRPRGGSVDMQEEQSTEQNILEKLQQTLQEETVEHTVRFQHEKAGKSNCNEIFQLFLDECKQQFEASEKIMQGFIWLVKKSIEQKYGSEYCQNNDASEIIEISNDLVTSVRQQYEKDFPISEKLLIELTKLFFDWLYKKMLTNHFLKVST